jgi:hypothetical protein
MNADSKEAAFGQDIIDQMVAGGWKLGDPTCDPCRLPAFPGKSPLLLAFCIGSTMAGHFG